MVDDGQGSGPSVIEWSSDNLTWNLFREDGLILWADWNNTELYVRVTDGANLNTISLLEIETPPLDTTDDVLDSDKENSAAKGGGAVSTLLALIVALAIVVLSVFTVMLAIRLRAQIEEEEEAEEAPEEAVASEPPEETMIQSESFHVPDYSHLAGGGVYDQSTGHMAYIDPEGRWWWQQEDGSFFHDPAFNANDATQDGLP